MARETGAQCWHWGDIDLGGIRIALFTDGLIARLKALGRIGRALQLVAGAILILMGIAMLTGQPSAFSYWLLDTFPALAKIS